MSLKAKVEAIIYAAEEPITLEQLSLLLKDTVLAELAAARENAAIEQADFEAESENQGENQDDDSYAAEAVWEIAGEAPGQAGDAPFETFVLPELDSSAEELPEPGPLMPAEEPAQAVEDAPENASFGEDDEPLFATKASIEAEAAPLPATGAAASVGVPDASAGKRQPKKSEQEIAEDKSVRTRLREILAELVADYTSEERGMEIRQIAGGFRMATKPQHHDVVRAFAKSLKPPIRLSLAALETLAVIAYKQPVTAPEIADIRGVESASVLGTLLDRKLITTSGRKQVIGRPMQYKTSKDFLLRFGLNDVNELPSMEEFSQLASDATIEIAPEAQQTASLFEAETGNDEVEAPNAPADDNAPAAGSAALPDAGPDAGDHEVEAQEPGSPLPETQPAATDQASANQPRSEAEPENIPEAGNPLGQ